MPNLAKLNQCTGCTACASACPKGCIAMVADENGFKYPVIDDDACVGCGLCEKSCPIVTPLAQSMMLPTTYAAYSKDEPMRLKSSSGGIFTELAKLVLAQGGAVYGAAYNKSFQVVHVCIENEAEIEALRGAKYAQSELGDTFSQIKKMLEIGRFVLFSGTPCQVAGLKAYLQREYENLITVDFVCHSVPSPMVWSKYVDSLGSIKSINLRAKDTGWSRYNYCHRVEDVAGVKVIPNAESLYMKLFVGDYINRESCSNCQFKGYSRCSDLTIGDFWGIWNIAPDMDDDKGTSVVLCQSERGAQLLRELGSRLMMKRVSLEEASRENGAMLSSSPMHPKRQEALEMIRNGRISECVEWFKTPKLTLKQKLHHMAKYLLRK